MLRALGGLCAVLSAGGWAFAGTQGVSVATDGQAPDGVMQVWRGVVAGIAIDDRGPAPTIDGPDIQGPEWSVRFDAIPLSGLGAVDGRVPADPGLGSVASTEWTLPPGVIRRVDIAAPGIDVYEGTLSVIPLPGAALLTVAGLGVLAGLRRRPGR